MKDEQEVWKEEVFNAPTEPVMREAFQREERVLVTIDGLGPVSMEVSELETTTAPTRMLRMTGKVEKPIPRLLWWWLKPKELGVYRVVITYFPENPEKLRIAEITLLETRVI